MWENIASAAGTVHRKKKPKIFLIAGYGPQHKQECNKDSAKISDPSWTNGNMSEQPKWAKIDFTVLLLPALLIF